MARGGRLEIMEEYDKAEEGDRERGQARERQLEDLVEAAEQVKDGHTRDSQLVRPCPRR